ncbi:hypothetical protein KFK09_004152 [Dendrobium nobile]|uniref:Endonuclease/exonuclease/phosphatase domain-containing protein n=1 Tax=Dendrobium nobile TaxID=94219 RepID=A0A8T3C504_DENNO|nr:hypothetical protein KFK09_004152 [Dendrobium nobile]
MRLLKWSPDFDVREESPIAPVWIAFPNLRLHFFNSHILFGLASVFGRPLQTDQATASLSRPSVARVLVELDVTKKHPQEIWLGSEMNGYFQKVEIENLPVFCLHCKMHGHAIKECFRLHPNLRKEKSGQNENGKMASTVAVVPVPSVENNLENVDLDLGAANSGNEVEVNVNFISALSNASKPVSNIPNFALNDKVVQDFVAQTHSNMALHDANIILDQEKWVNAEIVNSSNDLVVVLDEGEAVSSKALKTCNTDAINNVACNTTDNGEVPHNINVHSHDNLPITGQRLRNTSTVEDGVLFLQGEHSGLDPSTGEMNKDFLSTDHYNCDAFTDTKIEINAKCYAREDNDMSFSKEFVRIDFIGDFSQVLHCNIESSNFQCLASFVYAVTSCSLRKNLWDQLVNFHSIYTLPWLVGGDFNTIVNPSERVGGLHPNFRSMEDFNDMIMNCNLIDIGFSGNNFTWNRGNLWQWLDRVLFNNDWVNVFNATKVVHLSRTLSDHSPLLINVNLNSASSTSRFRFQNMWLAHNSFINVVHNNWSAPVFPDNSIYGMRRLWAKLKRLKVVLNWWNKNEFKNIFSNIKEVEERINVLKACCQNDPTDVNFAVLKEAKLVLTNLQYQEETYWKQKAAIKFLAEGDNNTSYFHALVSKKRAINGIYKIDRGDGTFTDDGDEIANLAVNFFQNRLNKNLCPTLIVDHSFIPCIVSQEENGSLCFAPPLEEVKNTLFDMNADSVAGPDGFTVKFFQHLWHFISDDVYDAVLDFFNGNLANANLWAKYMQEKYCGGLHPSLYISSKGHSKVWQRMVQIKWKVEPCLAWGLGEEMIPVLMFYKVVFTLEAFGIHYDSSVTFHGMNSVIWLKPPLNCFKLNFDISLIGSSWCIGGLIRNCAGDFVLGFAGKIVAADKRTAMLLAVCQGLNICDGLYIQNIVIEGNFNEDIKALVDGGRNIQFFLESMNFHFINVCPIVNYAARMIALFGGVVCLMLMSGKFMFSGLELCSGCVVLLVVVFWCSGVLVVPGWGLLGFLGPGFWLTFFCLGYEVSPFKL